MGKHDFCEAHTRYVAFSAKNLVFYGTSIVKNNAMQFSKLGFLVRYSVVLTFSFLIPLVYEIRLLKGMQPSPRGL